MRSTSTTIKTTAKTHQQYNNNNILLLRKNSNLQQQSSSKKKGHEDKKSSFDSERVVQMRVRAQLQPAAAKPDKKKKTALVDTSFLVADFLRVR
jgi:hypothetical protein